MVCVMCKYTSMTAGHTLLPLERDNKILILTSRRASAPTAENLT